MVRTLYVVPIPSSRAAWVTGSAVSPTVLAVASMGCEVYGTHAALIMKDL